MMNIHIVTLFACFIYVYCKDIDSDVETIARQLIMQQLAQEEQVRNNGWSGLKRQRLYKQGTRPYYNLGSMGSMHDHANYISTIGMGEFVGVLNGVEFRTRHNDYKMRQPSKSSKKYKSTQRIEFPKVPPEVTNKATVPEQIKEMQEWFAAWAQQNHTVRDYRRYFKPVLCYLEGAWTTSHTFEESFESDRHHLDARNWFDLLEKVRYIAGTGAKSRLENYAYLPTKILNMINGTVAQMAQWNYRILCHPLKDDLPLNRLRIVDDIAHRSSHKNTLEEHSRTRGARFSLNPKDNDRFTDGTMSYGLLDKLMEQIPGMDNYGAELYDEKGNEFAIKYESKNKEKLNVGYYSRWYKSALKDAMGESTRNRGYNDASLYMARTTQKKISAVRYERCVKSKCERYNQTWTYAIPLEINFMTPLQRWNPYNLEFKGEDTTKSKAQNRAESKSVTADGRYGSFKKAHKAYNGTRYSIYYKTPAEFFLGGEQTSSVADTSRYIKGVLDRKGNIKKMVASGTRIFFPYIKGAGLLRQRYPIMPLYHEGSSEWMEISALSDIVLNPVTKSYMFYESFKDTKIPRITLWTGKPVPNDHIHKIYVSSEQHRMLNAYRSVLVRTEKVNGHFHDMLITRHRSSYIMRECDGARSCFDKHSKYILTSDPSHKCT